MSVVTAAMLEEPRNVARPVRRVPPAALWVTLTIVAVGSSAVLAQSWSYYGTFIRGWDGQLYHAQARSLLIDRDLDTTREVLELSPQRAVFYDEHGEPWVRTDADGRPVNFHTIGSSLLTLPSLLAAHAVAILSGWPTDGYSLPYDVAAGVTPMAAAVAGAALLWLAAARVAQPWSASVAVIATFFGTNAVYYAAVTPLMNHAYSFAAVAAAAWIAVRLNDSPTPRRRWLAAGAAMAVITVLRPTDALFGVLFVPAAWRAVRQAEHPWALGNVGVLLPAVGVAAGAGVQLLAWRAMYGRWVLDAYGSAGYGFDWARPALVSLHLSSNHGAWYWHPVYAIATVGLGVAAWRDAARRPMWLAALAAVAGHAYVYGAWWCWWFGSGFGNRIFVNLAPIVALGLAWWLGRAGVRGRYAACGVLASLVIWNALLLAGSVLGHVPPVGEFGPAEVLEAQLKTLRSVP